MTERTKEIRAIRALQRAEPGGLSFERARKAVWARGGETDAQKIAALQVKLVFLEAANAGLSQRLDRVHVTGTGHSGFGPEKMLFTPPKTLAEDAGAVPITAIQMVISGGVITTDVVTMNIISSSGPYNP